MGSESETLITLAIRQHKQLREGQPAVGTGPLPRRGTRARLRALWASLVARLGVAGRLMQRLRPHGAGSAPQMPLQDPAAMAQRTMAALEEKIQTLSARVVELEERGSAPATCLSLAPLNLTTRGQVLKLCRGGQDPRQIASTLGVPIGEVNLLLKIQQYQSGAASTNLPAPRKGPKVPFTAMNRERTLPVPPADPLAIQIASTSIQ